jgi:hypothetical protein
MQQKLQDLCTKALVDLKQNLIQFFTESGTCEIGVVELLYEERVR